MQSCHRRSRSCAGRNAQTKLHIRGVRDICRPLQATQRTDVDVVVVGAGIIGLLTTHALLKEGLSVALVERKQLCAGATGAGQGYIWMAHRTVSTAAWHLASRSVQAWEQMVQDVPGLRSCIEWQDTGSMLLATNASESAELQQRQGLLQQHGIESRFLEPEQLYAAEPALSGTQRTAGGGVTVAGALVTDKDAQINGRRTAHELLSQCKRHQGLLLLLEEPADRLLIRPGAGCATGVATATRVLGSRLGTVVAAGVWSGELLSQATGNTQWAQQLQPRRGHLLELPKPQGMPSLHAGMMEMSYTKHYSAKGQSETSGVDITFTATSSASGTLLVGSSREFSGWGVEPSPAIVQAIMDRASLFLPHLQHVPLPEGPAVRVGLRPYATRGLPLIGPVPGWEGLFLAAGHEGSGLTLGPATAELLCHHILHDGGPSEQQLLQPHSLGELLPPNLAVAAS